jgi:CheY-like chemotaxis protein
MENKIQLMAADNLPLIEEAFASIENMEKFCNKILESKLAPDHFYPKMTGSNDRDYTKGNTAAVMMVLIQGNQLHLPVLTALQQIVPVNGLLSIKGDGAKGMILGSGKVQPGSWSEVESGSLEDGTYSVTISAERSDNHEKLSRTFTVAQAKRAGLWITEQQVNGADGWKWKKSAWYKYPDRMVKYRALGFLARDLFPDVMGGTYITEEARDIPQDTTEVIETESGAKLTLPDKEHSKQRSLKMTDRVADKIPDNKFGAVSSTITEAVIIPPETNQEVTQPSEPEKKEEPVITATRESSESMYGVKVIRDPQTNAITNMDEINAAKPQASQQTKQSEAIPGQLTLEQMEQMDTPLLLKMVMEDMDMMEAAETIGGKNTNKKLREIIFAHQNNELDKHVAPYLKAIKEKEEAEANAAVSTAPPVDTTRGEIPLNKEFDQPKITGTPVAKNQDILTADVKKPEARNKYGLVIPEFDKGEQREFGTMKQLFNTLGSVTPPINNTRYLELAGPMGLLAAFPDREAIAKFGTVKVINELLNKN